MRHGRRLMLYRPAPAAGVRQQYDDHVVRAGREGHPQGGCRPVDSEWRNHVQVTEK